MEGAMSLQLVDIVSQLIEQTRLRTAAMEEYIGVFVGIQRNALKDFEPEATRAQAAQLAQHHRDAGQRFERFNEGEIDLF